MECGFSSGLRNNNQLVDEIFHMDCGIGFQSSMVYSNWNNVNFQMDYET